MGEISSAPPKLFISKHEQRNFILKIRKIYNDKHKVVLRKRKSIMKTVKLYCESVNS